MGSKHPPGWGSVHAPPPGFQLTSTPTGEQFDTITLSTLPTSPSYLAGYTAGFWPTFLPLVRAYPHAKVKSIAIAAQWHAMCLDIEPGDATPSQAPAWVRADIAAGFPRPCLYSSYWEFVNQVIPAMNAAGIPRSAYWAWDADYVFYSRIDSGFDCTQWTDRALGRNLDESTCTLAFLGAQPTPPPTSLGRAWLTRTELNLVRRYDGAAQQHKYDAYRTRVLEPQLAALAHAIWIAHQHGGTWAFRHRGIRFQELYRRLGQVA